MAQPNRSTWWTFTKRGYRLTEAGAAGLANLAPPANKPPRRAGQYISGNTLRNARDTWIDSYKPVSRELARQLKNGEIDATAWVLKMREEIKDATRAQYILARGGLGNMVAKDWGILGNHLRGQYEYLNDFARQIIANPDWSEARIAARSQGYFEASSAMFERGNQEGKGAPKMPQYPGDGKTRCLSNCKCWWDIQEDGSWWLCYWRTRPAEHCEDCLENAAKWNPLALPKVNLKNRDDVVRFLEVMKEVA